MFEDGYDYDGYIGPFFYAVADEEDIEYYIEEVIDPLVEFQLSMDPAAAYNI